MGDVVSLTVVPGDGYQAQADEILDGAKGKLAHCVVIGWDENRELYVRTTDGDAETNLLIDAAKRQLMDGLFED